MTEGRLLSMCSTVFPVRTSKRCFPKPDRKQLETIGNIFFWKDSVCIDLEQVPKHVLEIGTRVTLQRFREEVWRANGVGRFRRRSYKVLSATRFLKIPSPLE